MALFGFKRKQKEQEQETLEAGLEKTRTGLFDKLSRAVAGKDTVD